MACALPVVAMRGGAIAELVAQHGLVVGRRSADALARAIVAAFERDPAAMGLAARSFVEQHYTWDAVLRGLLQQYAGVLAAAGRGLEAQAYGTL
jgi:alpha-1,6-mannosyltransferase